MSTPYSDTSIERPKRNQFIHLTFWVPRFHTRNRIEKKELRNRFSWSILSHQKGRKLIEAICIENMPESGASTNLCWNNKKTTSHWLYLVWYFLVLVLLYYSSVYPACLVRYSIFNPSKSVLNQSLNCFNVWVFWLNCQATNPKNTFTGYITQ